MKKSRYLFCAAFVFMFLLSNAQLSFNADTVCFGNVSTMIAKSYDESKAKKIEWDITVHLK